MLLEEVAKLYSGRKYGKSYRAKCPVHHSKGLTLHIFDDPKDESVGVKCYAGCSQSDVLKSAGLTKGALYYRVKMTGAEKASYERARRISEAVARELNRKLWTGVNIERLASQSADALAELMAMGNTELLADYQKRLDTLHAIEWRNQARPRYSGNGRVYFAA